MMLQGVNMRKADYLMSLVKVGDLLYQICQKGDPGQRMIATHTC